MVTKHTDRIHQQYRCLILAKNHMVTKRLLIQIAILICLILAKNHMVTKQSWQLSDI